MDFLGLRTLTVIKDTKEFYRPTKDIIYSGDTLIDIAEQNLKILKEVE